MDVRQRRDLLLQSITVSALFYACLIQIDIKLQNLKDKEILSDLNSQLKDKEILKCDLNSQLNYLQVNVIVPYLNRKVYEKAGLDKVVKGLVLHGDDNEGMDCLVEEIGNGLFDLGWNKFELSKKSNYWKDPSSMYHNPEFSKINEVFKSALNKKASIISIKDVDPQFEFMDGTETNLRSLLYVLDTPMNKIRSDDGVVVILIMDHLEVEAKKHLEKLGFSKFLQVSKPWTTERLKNAFTTATSEWENKPKDEILDIIVEKMTCLKNVDNLQMEIDRICFSVYRKCLERFVGKCGTSCRVRGVDINPDVQDWVDEIVANQSDDKFCQNRMDSDSTSDENHNLVNPIQISPEVEL